MKPGRTESTSLEGMLKEFISSLGIERGLSDNTCQAYRADCKRFLDSLPSELLRSPRRIDDRQLFDFLVEQRRGGRQVASVRRSMSALRTFFRFLRGRGIIEDDPTRFLDTPQTGSRLPSVLSVDEIDRLLFIVRDDLDTHTPEETVPDIDPQEYMQQKRQESPVIQAIFEQFGGELVW